MEHLIRKFAHELRNPLTSLSCAIQLIESKHPEVKDFKYWSGLHYDLEFMNDLIQEFSDLSKSESLHITTFSLRDLLQRVSLSFAASVADSDIEYTSYISSSLPQITGDKTKLQEVFSNILKNASEACTAGGKVRMDAISEQDFATVTIQDTGCGMTEQQLLTIFDPFVTYKSNGTGLGLAICDHIVKAHGGTISVKSTMEEGSVFTIVIPLSPAP